MINMLVGGNPLFITGIVMIAVSVSGGIIALAALRLSGKRLKMKLEKEFGKKRHQG